MHHTPLHPETKREAFARLRPICRDRLKAEHPQYSERAIDGMLVTYLELEYDAERSQFARDAKQRGLWL